MVSDCPAHQAHSYATKFCITRKEICVGFQRADFYGTAGRGRAGLRLHGHGGRRQAVRAGGQLDFPGFPRGLHDDLREAVEHAALPFRRDGLFLKVQRHALVEAARAVPVRHGDGDGVFARMQERFHIKDGGTCQSFDSPTCRPFT